MIDKMLLVLSYLLALICLGATLLPLSKSEVWWVRAADFPRLQIAIAAAIALIGIVAATPGVTVVSGVLAVSLLLAVIYHLVEIIPYTPLWAKEMSAADDGDGGVPLSIMIANVLMDNRENEMLFSMIEHHQPDIILAVETDAWWCEQLDARTADWPHKISYPLDNTYGMFLASRLALIDPEVRFLLKDDIPSLRAGVRLASGEPIDLYALHPEPPSPTEADTALPRDAELITVAKEIAERGRSAVVMGDLNDVAWSHTSRLFRRLGRMLDPRIGRGLFSTFHASYWPIRWPLDHVFASDDFLLGQIRRLDAFGSDHFPILVTLRRAQTATQHQNAEEADDTDLEEARDKLARGEVDVASQVVTT